MIDSSQQQQCSEGFISRLAFEKTLGEIKEQTAKVNAGAPVTALEEAYNKLLDLREIAYPLLLQDGEPLALASEPINMRLIPPIEGLAQRWLLAYFPTTRQAPYGSVQLLEWRVEKHGSRVQPVNGQAPQPIEVGEEELPVNLGERPLQVQMQPMGNSVLIKLIFPHGEITITADIRRGIRAVDWTKGENGLRYAERYSWGEMNTAVQIQRRLGEYWADDEILRPAGVGLAIPGAIGHIRGADGLQNNSAKVFLASDNSHVYGINLAQPNAQPLQCLIPTGPVQDVLMIQTEIAAGSAPKHKPYLLAAAEDGSVYLLRVADLQLMHWQYTQRHIQRIIGCGGRQILALDQRGSLVPLSVADVSEYYDIKNDATQALCKHSPSIPPAFQPGDAYAWSMRRGLELLFWRLKDHQPLPEPTVLAAIPGWYAATPADAPVVARLHRQLLRRFFEWLSAQYFATADKRSQVSAENFAPFWSLLNLPEQAPPGLWLWLLQEQDWLELYVRERNIDLTGKLRVWRQRLADEQEKLAKTYAFFPLHPWDSGRFTERIRHLRTLDAQRGLLVMGDTEQGIRVVRCPTENEAFWQELTLKVPALLPIGEITTLCVLPPEARQRWPYACEYLVVLGSNRGELRVWGLDIAGDEAHATVLSAPDDLPLSLLCSHYLPERHGLLLSGCNDQGQGALYWFSFAKPGDSRQLWHTETAGYLHMMTLARDGRRLWILNRWPDQLLYFPDIQRFFEKHKDPGCQIWLHARRALHALGFAEALDTVVCGGDEGLTLAYDGKSGRLKWAVHCGSNVRRIRYLPGGVNKAHEGLWVLSGDSNESLLLGGDCGVRGIQQHDSPASALWPMETNTGHQLLLGTLNGQILRFTARNNAPVLLPDRTVFLQRLRNSVRGQPEPLLEAQRVSTEAAELLLALPGDEELALAVADYLSAGTVAADAVFFHRLLSGGIGQRSAEVACRQEIVGLCRRAWAGYAWGLPNKRRGAVGKALSGIMAVLEALTEPEGTSAMVAPLRQSALGVLQEIGDQLWHESAPTTTGPEHSPLPAETRQAVHLSQLLRQWYATEERTQDIPARLHQWCKRLTRHWGLGDGESFRARLRQGFASHLVLTGCRQDAWETWFQRLLAEEPYGKSAPLPLAALEQPRSEPLPEVELNALAASFPGNEPWETWLSNLQHALGLVREQAVSASGIAWQEQASWLALRDHWQGKGNDTFTLSNGQGLLALWWPRLCRLWLEHIDHRLDEWRASVKARAVDYLPLTWVDRWHSADEVVLELQLRNHYLGLLKLIGAEWNHQPQEIAEVSLPAEKAARLLVLPLRCAQPEQLRGRLALRYVYVETGDAFTRYLDISADRSLDRFAPGAQWQPTWRRLIELLKGAQAFLWVDGAHWSGDERRRLKQMVYDQHGLDLCQTSERCVLVALDEAVTDAYAGWPVFSPDVPLGNAGGNLLESVQELLCPVAGKFSLLALAVWQAWRGLPEAVAAALADRLPPVVAVKGLLMRLLSEDAELIDGLAQALRRLPRQALGAWCRGEPVYPEGSGPEAELYFPPACAITGMLWDCLDAAKVPVEQIAEFLNQDCVLAEKQRRQREALRHSWAALEQPDNPALEAETLAEILLQCFTPEKLQKAEPVGWFAEDSGFPSRIQLRFEEFKRCYVLPRTSAITRAKLKTSSPPALWLCLTEEQTPKELPGLALALHRDDCLALLHMDTSGGDNGAVLRLLNRMAFHQLPPDPEGIWRSAGGLGEQVGKHFVGREHELAVIRASLCAADEEKAAAVLVVGSKRIGKTTLRQRICYEIEQEMWARWAKQTWRERQPRLVLELDFQSMPPELRGVELEYFFFQRWADQMARINLPLRENEEWPSAYKDSIAWRNKARTLIIRRMGDIRKRTGYAPLLSLDETDHLARADYADPRHRHALFNFLRELSTRGVCLLATSFPHGPGRCFALNVACHNATSPLNNTFKVLTLTGLQPDEAWTYLRGKLAGLGVILPEHYRQPMLCLSQGIPWIVQTLGKALYQAARHGNVVRTDHWSLAQRLVMQEVGAMLRTTVESVAQAGDDKSGLSAARAPERCLGHSRLWTALLKLIRAKQLDIAPSERWPDELEFGLGDLREYLPQVAYEHLKEALNDLAPSPVVDGVLGDAPDSFKFTSNLLPAWVTLQGESA